MQPDPKHTSNLLCPLSSLLYTRRGKSFVTNEISQTPSEHSYAPVGLSILVAALILFTLASLQAQTHVSGEVSGVWTVDRSPYYIDTLAVIPEEETLTIDPGVEVVIGANWNEDGFGYFYDTLRVIGQLIADGTQDDSIKFLTDPHPFPPGIIMFEFIEEADTSLIDYSHIQVKVFVRRQQFIMSHSLIIGDVASRYLNFLPNDDGERGGGGRVEFCKFYRAGTDIEAANPTITHCEFIRNGILNYEGASPVIEHCNSDDATIGFYSGASGVVRNSKFKAVGASSPRLYPLSNPLIENCILEGFGAGGDSAKPVLRNCLIIGNYFSGSGGVFIADSAQAIIENNIISANNGLTIQGYGFPPQPGIFRNNILIYCNNGYKCESRIFYDPEELGIDHNILWQVYEPLVYVNALGAHDTIVDPQLRGAPMFRSRDWSIDYRLTAGSPAIDAGDPESDEDPDGTRRDIGAFFFDRRLNHPPHIISQRDVHASDRDTLRYWAKVIDDGDEVEIEVIGLPDWLEVAQRRDLAQDSMLIFGYPPEDLLRDSLRIVAIDSEGQTDSLTVFITIDHSPLEGALSGALTRANSPYTAVEDISVDAGDTLTIEPGVTIRFNKRENVFYSASNIGFLVEGILLCEGTEEDSITFTSNQPYPLKRDWWGVEIEGAGSVGSHISYTNIEYGDFSNLDLYYTAVEVTNSRFAHAGRGIKIMESQGVIENNLFIECGLSMGNDTVRLAPVRNNVFVDGSLGCYYTPAGVMIEGNIFTDNKKDGDVVHLLDFSGTFQNNIIINNGWTEERWALLCSQALALYTAVPIETSYIIRNNLIVGNAGGIFFGTGGVPPFMTQGQFINNTIADNGAGVLLGSMDEDVLMFNNIVTGNKYGIDCLEQYGDFVNYNLSWGNELADYIFSEPLEEPPGTNISVDPQYFGMEPFRYRLSGNSPAIDAGDPESPEDRDGTRADIGYHYYNQNNNSPVIRDFAPRDTILAVQNEPVHFSIEVFDEDEADSLVYRWFLSGSVVGEESDVNIAFPDTGLTRLTAVVMDGTDADSVWWIVQVSPNWIGEETKPPLQYALHQSYPNPFNDYTIVPYELPEATEVEIVLYDIMGRMIKALTSGRREAGHHRLVMKAGDLASGVYVLRMNTKKYQKSIRIAHIK